MNFGIKNLVDVLKKKLNGLIKIKKNENDECALKKIQLMSGEEFFKLLKISTQYISENENLINPLKVYQLNELYKKRNSIENVRKEIFSFEINAINNYIFENAPLKAQIYKSSLEKLEKDIKENTILHQRSKKELNEKLNESKNDLQCALDRPKEMKREIKAIFIETIDTMIAVLYKKNRYLSKKQITSFIKEFKIKQRCSARLDTVTNVEFRNIFDFTLAFDDRIKRIEELNSSLFKKYLKKWASISFETVNVALSIGLTFIPVFRNMGKFVKFIPGIVGATVGLTFNLISGIASWSNRKQNYNSAIVDYREKGSLDKFFVSFYIFISEFSSKVSPVLQEIDKEAITEDEAKMAINNAVHYIHEEIMHFFENVQDENYKNLKSIFLKFFQKFGDICLDFTKNHQSILLSEWLSSVKEEVFNKTTEIVKFVKDTCTEKNCSKYHDADNLTKKFMHIIELSFEETNNKTCYEKYLNESIKSLISFLGDFLDGNLSTKNEKYLADKFDLYKKELKESFEKFKKNNNKLSIAELKKVHEKVLELLKTIKEYFEKLLKSNKNLSNADEQIYTFLNEKIFFKVTQSNEDEKERENSEEKDKLLKLEFKDLVIRRVETEKHFLEIMSQYEIKYVKKKKR